MRAEQAVASGSSCKVRLALVFPENQFSEHLELSGMIAWCTPIQGAFQIGVKFNNPDPQSVSFLDLFIRFLDEGSDDDEPEPGSSAESP
jgi:hypothetical protein